MWVIFTIYLIIWRVTNHSLIYWVTSFVRKYTRGETRHNFLHIVLMAAAQDIVVNSHVDPLETKTLFTVYQCVIFCKISKALIHTKSCSNKVLKPEIRKGTSHALQVITQFRFPSRSLIYFLVILRKMFVACSELNCR